MFVLCSYTNESSAVMLWQKWSLSFRFNFKIEVYSCSCTEDQTFDFSYFCCGRPQVRLACNFQKLLFCYFDVLLYICSTLFFTKTFIFSASSFSSSENLLALYMSDNELEYIPTSIARLQNLEIVSGTFLWNKNCYEGKGYKHCKIGISRSASKRLILYNNCIHS